MIITADIGGTNARMELHTLEGLKSKGLPLFKRTYPSDKVPSFSDLLRSFMSDAGQSPTSVKLAVCGVPGDVSENKVEAINIKHWGVIDGTAAARETGIRKVYLLNDFECAAYALNDISDNDVACMRKGSSASGSIKCMIGVGTGLGVAFASLVEDHFQPRPSESGWIPFWELSDRDRELARAMRKILNTDTVSFEQVCAGPSLVRLYEIAAQRNSEPILYKSPKDICMNYNHSKSAQEATDMMIEYLGRFISVLSLVYKPTGGVYLTGGTMDSLFSIIGTSSIFQKGLDSQSHPILLSIARSPSIYYIRKEDIGMWGAREYALIMHKKL